MTAIACPSAMCPCERCAGDRARVEREAQGLPSRIEDRDFYACLANHLAATVEQPAA